MAKEDQIGIMDLFDESELGKTLDRNEDPDQSIISSRVSDHIVSEQNLETGDRHGRETVSYNIHDESTYPSGDVITMEMGAGSSKNLSSLTETEKLNYLKNVEKTSKGNEPLYIDSSTQRFIEENKDKFTDVFKKSLSVTEGKSTLHRRRQDIKTPQEFKFEDFTVQLGEDGSWQAEFMRADKGGGTKRTEILKGKNVVDLTKAIKDFGPMEDVSRFFDKLKNDNKEPEMEKGTQDIEDTLVNQWTAPGSIYN